MADVQITCIKKPHPQSSHEHITHVGNSQGTWTREQVIMWIDTSAHTFYVRDGYGNRANIGVVRPTGVAAYLRTYADKTWTDNLLSLPQCP